MERVMSKTEVLEKTIEVLGTIELPVYQASLIATIQGAIKNLSVVLQMIDEEEKNKKEEKAVKDGAE